MVLPPTNLWSGRRGGRCVRNALEITHPRASLLQERVPETGPSDDAKYEEVTPRAILKIRLVRQGPQWFHSLAPL